MKNYCLFLLSFLLLACNSKQAKETTDHTQPLIQKDTTFYFSNLQAKDTFSIWLDGDEITEASFNFLIKNAAGQNIYFDDFHVSALAVPYVGAADFEAYSKENILFAFHAFFNSGIQEPAISSEREFNAEFNYCSQTLWNKIKSNKQSRGFCYQFEHAGLCITPLNKQLIRYIY